MDTIYSWLGGTSTDCGDATNWFDATDGIAATAPPGTGNAIELTGSGTIDGTASGLTSLTVSATSAGGYALGATLDASSIEISGALTLTGRASVSADTLGVDAGTLAMQDGSFLTTGGQALEISVSGAAASAPSLLQLDSGSSLYTAGGSVQVGAGSGQAGTLLVAGGSLACDMGGTLAVGADGASGSVSITDGGSVAVYSGLALGVSGQGLLTLGPGAQLETDNFSGGPALVLGTTDAQSSSAGQGTLVSYGATLMVSGGALIGDIGQADLVAGGGTMTTDSATLGVAAGSSGTLALGANETWQAGIVAIGAAGNGTVQMTASAAGSGAVTIDTLSLGTAGGNGTLAIAHETLHVRNTTELGAGGGRNSVTVGAGGVWDSAGQGVFLDASATGGGNTLSVSGAGAVFDAATLFGFAGSRIAFGAGARGVIGTDPGTDSFGTAGGTITVANAALTVGGLMGARAAGTLSVSGTSSLSASAGLLVHDPLSTVALAGGVVSVSSPSGTAVQVDGGGTLAVSGGVLTAHGALSIAAHGAGTLQLSSGGTIACGSVSVGGAASTQGSLSLAGSGDVLSTGLLSIGSFGTVTLGSGSHLSAGGLLLGTAGQGVATPHAAALAIAGGRLAVFGGASLHGGVVLSQGGTLAVSNGLTLAAGSTIVGQGVLAAGSIVDLGRIGCGSGTMTCLGPVSGTGLLSVANGSVVLAQGEASTVGLVFGASGTFTAAAVGQISGTITGWTSGDALDFTSAHIASDSLSGHVLTLFDGAGHVLGRETFAGNVASSNFSLSADHGEGTMLSFHA